MFILRRSTSETARVYGTSNQPIVVLRSQESWRQHARLVTDLAPAFQDHRISRKCEDLAGRFLLIFLAS